MLPFLGSMVLLLLLVLAGLYLWHQDKLPLPKLGGHRSPEEGAKRILAERFARGDISSDEFLGTV
jgi:putative membrane protein